MIKLNYETIKEIYMMVLKHDAEIMIVDDKWVSVPQGTFEPYVWNGEEWDLDYNFIDRIHEDIWKS